MSKWLGQFVGFKHSYIRLISRYDSYENSYLKFLEIPFFIQKLRRFKFEIENYSIKQYNSIVLYKRWPGGVIASEILFWEHFMRNAQKLTRIAYQTQFMTFLIVWEFLFQNHFYDVGATTKFKSEIRKILLLTVFYSARDS